MKTIDVIIPTFNGMPYLQAAIESVLAQTHQQWQLYVVDDGSTDDGATKKYVESLEDARITYLAKSNGGQATARNYGIKHSDSPYIAFLDSDDIWHPSKLEKQLVLLITQRQTGLIYGLCDYINEHNDITGECKYEKRGRLFNYLLHGNRITGSASMVLVKRSVFDKVGLFKEDFLIGEDWEMWLRIARSYQIDYVPEKLAALRQRSDGMQRDFLKMARGLTHMLPIMEQELMLTRRQRRILAGTCLSDAAYFYELGRDRVNGLKYLLACIRRSPLTFLWVLPPRFTVYARILIGNHTKSLRKSKTRHKE